ncbi:hypothetical protein EHF33_15500 [Deinococcus psychrotolerans]|uniref:Uncharacterized protein n=1 Tax=Deinococcus psychrotolerans TaxID=2489213 RepID=A0A3G8YH37_9DEIO|nr:hypothetical protein [Deinococcus psychrotolerans]AZI44293.1 hypothetical protein EHF33_15500 [Deinococcus psychrotolerans]
MKRLLLTALLLAPLTAQARNDLSTTLTTTQATRQNLTLTLGPGALATLTFPEAVTDATVTRSGLIDTKIVGNRILLAGLASSGNTPIQITTETQVYTWRVQLSSDAAGSIVSVTITDPSSARTPAQSAPAFPSTAAPPPVNRGVVTPQSQGILPDQPRSAVQIMDSQGDVRSTPMPSSASPVDVRLSASRDEDTVVLQYRLQASTADATFDERQLSVTGAVVRPTLSTFKVNAGQVRYGTVTIGASPSLDSLPVHWVYRVGMNTVMVDQQVAVR